MLYYRQIRVFSCPCLNCRHIVGCLNTVRYSHITVNKHKVSCVYSHNILVACGVYNPSISNIGYVYTKQLFFANIRRIYNKVFHRTNTVYRKRTFHILVIVYGICAVIVDYVSSRLCKGCAYTKLKCVFLGFHKLGMKATICQKSIKYV